MPEEFNAICRAYNSERDSLYRNEWERMRMLATITIQPHLKKKITPGVLLPFPWEAKRSQNVKILPKNEEKERIRELMSRLEKNS